MNIIFSTVIIYFICLQTSSYAYLDPGTGSIILTAIISVFAFISFKIRIIYEKIKKIFFKKNTNRK